MGHFFDNPRINLIIRFNVFFHCYIPPHALNMWQNYNNPIKVECFFSLAFFYFLLLFNLSQSHLVHFMPSEKKGINSFAFFRYFPRKLLACTIGSCNVLDFLACCCASLVYIFLFFLPVSFILFFAFNLP